MSTTDPERPSSIALGGPRTILSGSLHLAGYLARPTPSAAKGAGRFGLVLCHGFPADPQSARLSAATYPQLVDRLATEAGWVVLSFNFRGTGESEGNFSLAGWMADLEAAIEQMFRKEGVEGVWLCGFSAGGSLAICVAAADERVRGVATFAAPADFGEWAADPRRFVVQARQLGMIRSATFPTSLDDWAAELRDIRPLSVIARIPPRPLLIVHGSADEVVPMLDARALADAAEEAVELRILAAAGHRLRHDPRAVAVLLGWLDRQSL